MVCLLCFKKNLPCAWSVVSVRPSVRQLGTPPPQKSGIFLALSPHLVSPRTPQSVLTREGQMTMDAPSIPASCLLLITKQPAHDRV